MVPVNFQHVRLAQQPRKLGLSHTSTTSGSKEGREGGYQIPVPSLNLAQIPVPRLIFAKIPVTKSKIPLLMIICKIMRIIKALIDAIWIHVPSL